MPYLLLKTLISLHCGNPSKNLSSKVSYFEVLKAFLASAYGWRSLLRRAKQRHRCWRRWAILWARVVSVAA
ncbi:MAG: hypothetical protein ACYT04_37420 [Nostoc sp.]